ncbi:zinc finger protein 23 [Electrophorus electricus]|uniref:C2H2-type domain-containing protein n=1 Tax=Electrophorus electricus TaxID=8005 RepID=A0AAY5F2P1_ELEEL|nr:zinc finger protein 23 [Electrophorus electricus]
MSDSVAKFQAEVAAVMEVLLKVAVMEITKVFEGRSFLSEGCTVDGRPNIRAEPLPDLKACMEGALRSPANKIVCSVGVQVGETTPVEAHDKGMTRERSKLCLQTTQMGEGLSPTESPFIDLVETVDVQCTVDFPYTIFKEKTKRGERGDTITLSPAWGGVPQGEGSSQENDLQDPSPLHDPLPSSVLENKPLFSTVTTTDLSLQSLGHSHPEVISLLPVEEQAKVEPLETVVSPEEQAHPSQNVEKPCATMKVNTSNSLTGVKKVQFQLSQSPFDCKMLRPCSVQLVNLLLASGPKKRSVDVGPNGKGFSMPKDLRAHQGAHTGRRLCCFTACGNGVWRLHASPSQERLYGCKICGKSFKRRKILRRHYRFHTGEKPYSCPNCNKAFALRKSLRRHERFHSGERPHVCPQCGKSFRLRDNLKAHQRFHTGEKPFTCSLCSKSFRIHKNLQKHSIIHSVPGIFNSVK